MTVFRLVRDWISRRRWRPDIWTLLLVGAIVYLWFRPPAWVSTEHHPVGDIEVRMLDGQTRVLSQLRGKVVLVNFWASWCPYCRHEMPAMEQFYRAYRARGFEILALSEDNDPAAAVNLVNTEGYTFPAGMASGSSIAAFGAVNRLPTSFVIDKRGIVRYRISGQVHYSRLKSLVEPLLTE